MMKTASRKRTSNGFSASDGENERHVKPKTAVMSNSNSNGGSKGSNNHRLSHAPNNSSPKSNHHHHQLSSANINVSNSPVNEALLRELAASSPPIVTLSPTSRLEGDEKLYGALRVAQSTKRMQYHRLQQWVHAQRDYLRQVMAERRVRTALRSWKLSTVNTVRNDLSLFIVNDLLEGAPPYTKGHGTIYRNVTSDSGHVCRPPRSETSSYMCKPSSWTWNPAVLFTYKPPGDKIVIMRTRLASTVPKLIIGDTSALFNENKRLPADLTGELRRECEVMVGACELKVRKVHKNVTINQLTGRRRGELGRIINVKRLTDENNDNQYYTVADMADRTVTLYDVSLRPV